MSIKYMKITDDKIDQCFQRAMLHDKEKTLGEEEKNFVLSVRYVPPHFT